MCVRVYLPSFPAINFFTETLETTTPSKRNRIASFFSLSSFRFAFVRHLYSEEKGTASSRTRTHARTHRTHTHTHTRTHTTHRRCRLERLAGLVLCTRFFLVLSLNMCGERVVESVGSERSSIFHRGVGFARTMARIPALVSKLATLNS